MDKLGVPEAGPKEIKISQLIRPTKIGIWVVRIINHWKIRVLR